MAKNKLFQYLSILSKRELQEFRSYLLSHYLNQSEIRLELFDYIRSCHPDFNQKRLEYPLIFKALRPNKPYVKKFVINTMSYLTESVEDFLAIQYLKRHPLEKQRLIRENLLVHKQYERYLSKTRKALENITKKPKATWQFNLEAWTLAHTIFSHPQTQRYNEAMDKMQDANKYLDEGYAILKLRYGLHQLFRGQIFSTDEQSIPLLNAVIQQFSDNTNPIIQLYILMLDLFKQENQATAWENAYSLLFQHIHSLPFEEKEVFITSLINTGHVIAKEKQPTFFKKIFNLYQKGLEQSVWTALGEIEPVVFKNIATIAASTQKTDWAEEFIEQYQSFLPMKERENAVKYAKAYVFFYKGKYAESIDYLNALPQKSMTEKLTYKSLISRCLYEQRCKDDSLTLMLEHFLKSFSKFLIKAQLSMDSKESYKNLLYFIGLLNKERRKPKKEWKSKEILLVRLEKRPRFVAYHWIVQKIEEL